jgi:branched-chain amino acid transport system substrate-binding protein
LRRTPRTRTHGIPARWVGALIAATLAASACGSGLSRQELLAANQVTAPVAASVAAPAGAGSAPSDTAAMPGADAATSAEPAVASPTSGAAVLPAAGRPAATPGSPGQPRVATDLPGRSAAAGGGGPATPAGGMAGAGGPAPAAAPAAAAGGEIRLGSFGTQTGPLGGILLPLVQGAKAWVADVNARGGLGGRPVRLVMADDGGDPNRALALARRMVEEDKVQAFYAVHSPTALQAAIPYVEQRQVPIIGACECSPVGDDSPMVFHPGTGSKMGVYWAHLAPLLKYSDKRKVAVLYCREAATCAGIKDGMKPLGKPNGIDWVYEAQVSLAQPDFTAEVLAARNAGADAIIAVVDNASIIRLLRSADRQDYHPVISSQQATYEDRFLRDGGDLINGVLVASNSAPYNTAPQLADYRSAMDRYIPSGIKSAFGGEMWGVGKLLERLAGDLPANPSSGDFINALHALRGETVGGIFPPITFRPGVGHGDTNQCIIPVKVEGHQFVPASNTDFFCPPGWKPVQS